MDKDFMIWDSLVHQQSVMKIVENILQSQFELFAINQGVLTL